MTLEQIEKLREEYESAKELLFSAVDKYGKENSKLKVGEIVKYRGRKYEVTNVQSGLNSLSKDLRVEYSYNLKGVANKMNFHRNISECFIDKIITPNKGAKQ